MLVVIKIKPYKVLVELLPIITRSRASTKVGKKSRAIRAIRVIKVIRARRKILLNTI